ncbi:HAD family hydrolase [Pseudomonas sp. F1_0610]|uniref:HAD family hydrolase n=1 Tax=Pseudomonas sp. F1_0610 TaxID=3114284 RepID=UPI0039C05BC8
MLYKHLLFDLDGTLTDSSSGIYNAINFALQQLGLAPQPSEVLKSFIGPPLVDSFSQILKLSPEQTKQALVLYRQYYKTTGLYENTPYSGIINLLERLKNKGYTLYLATSKPEAFAITILQHFQLSMYFTGIYGATFDASRSQKADVIRYALIQSGNQEFDKTLMIGDRYHDISGALINHIQCCGVTYGFGSKEELQQAGATYLVESVAQLAQLLGVSDQ